jgi:DNA gyrase/topoisomerase IV subunit A
MKNQTKLELEAILDGYEKKQLEERLRQDQEQYELETYIEDFKELREKVIRPVMEDMGDILEQKGHDFKIKEKEYSMDKKAFATEARIEFKIFPRSNAEEFYAENHPSVMFSSDVTSRNIKVHGSYVMPGRRGERELIRTYAISEITSDNVEKEILDILIKAFNA